MPRVDIRPPGLTGTPEKDWPKLTKRQLDKRPIDLLSPRSKKHMFVRDYLLERLEASERAMTTFYSRWSANERRVQAWIDLPDWEEELKKANDSGAPPNLIRITLPYSFATIATIVTYLIHTFSGRKPMFQVGTYKPETNEAATKLEMILQFQSDHTRLIKEFFKWFTDGEMYGLGVMKINWEDLSGQRTVWKEAPSPFFGVEGMGEKVRVRERRLIYQGNKCETVDPYMFFPDPRVPMSDVNRKGEFVFWRSFVGKHELKKQEAQGKLRWLDHVGDTVANRNADIAPSSRHLLSSGNPIPGIFDFEFEARLNSAIQIDQGTIDLIPAEVGLGESEEVEKWIFTMGNKHQIIQAEPFPYDHEMHPVSVIEPYSLGYGFGQPGLGDYLAPIQDAASWFINSHIKNVRTAINNMLVVDPMLVELQDLKETDAGLIIRLKPTAIGKDVRSAVTQLQISDVTKNHVNDLREFLNIGDAISGINDNVRGQQDSGSRKTATEVRTTGEAAASRLAAHARLISAQGVVDLAEQMAINTQQFMSMDFWLQVLGVEGKRDSLHISPEHIVGDFFFPVHDGVLPLDKVAMLDAWKELFVFVASDPELRQRYNMDQMFKHIAELGGVKNLEKFIVDVAPDDIVAQKLQEGNVFDIARARNGLNSVSGQTPGVEPQPGQGQPPIPAAQPGPGGGA